MAVILSPSPAGFPFALLRNLPLSGPIPSFLFFYFLFVFDWRWSSLPNATDMNVSNFFIYFVLLIAGHFSFYLFFLSQDMLVWSSLPNATDMNALYNYLVLHVIDDTPGLPLFISLHFYFHQQ
jgi:hypothetical protein